MSNIMSRRGALAAALAGVALFQLPAQAADRRLEELTLKSGYSGNWLVSGARRVSLSVTLNHRGSGSGTLTLDPNIYDRGTSTQIAMHEIAVQVQLVQDDEQTAKGRRLYELKRTGLDGAVEHGGERWFLVRPIKERTPSSLIFADKEGKLHDVLMLE